jgi:hypothetical protein
MGKKVDIGCRDCKRWTNSMTANAGRKAAKGMTLLMTGGMSGMVSAMRKKCRQCGHQMSLHQPEHAAPYGYPTMPSR